MSWAGPQMMDLVVFVQSVDWVGLLSQVATTCNATPSRKHRSTVTTEETQPATPGVREHKHNPHHLKSVSLCLKLGRCADNQNGNLRWHLP